ncbi:MAG: alpha/beta hydrolase [Calothrix sp. MO_167.B42]|nr:alpha/beta hydrolase [Calothrix sp. MO_167.B42]
MKLLMQLPIGINRYKSFFVKGWLYASCMTLGWCLAMPRALAAEKVNIRLGPFQQSVEIGDLEKFAKTGKLPSKLQIFSPVLTPQMGQLLTQRFQIDPKIADRFFDSLMKTSAGKQLISSLANVIPGSSPETLKTGLYLTLRQVDGLSLLGFLRAYPQTSVTIDAAQAISLAMKINPTYLSSIALGNSLQADLLVKNNPKLPTSFNPAQAGTNTVRTKTIRLTDRTRNRVIPVDIYWSPDTKKTQTPLVVISHGFGANRTFLAYLARHLASHGITVAALEHPGSNSMAVNQATNKGNLQDLISPTEFSHRPQDVSFLLDEFAKLNSQPGVLNSQLNANKATVIGHSLGGYTALALVGAQLDLEHLRRFCQSTFSLAKSPGDWLQCAAKGLKGRKLQFQDSRVKNAIAFNPLVGEIFGPQGMAKVKNPVLIFTGTEDTLTPAISHQIKPFQQLQGNKYLLTAIGGTHLSISDSTYKNSAINNIVPEKRGQQTQPLRQMLQGITLAFIQQQTPSAKAYQPFLTPGYVQSFSTPQIPLRLTSSLPGSIKRWLKFL